MRYTFFKTDLLFENGNKLPITVATHDITRIEALVNSNRMLYTTTQGSNITGHPITEVRYTFDMTNEAYEEELQFCDIVDD
jgi:hypothetical protein